MIIFSGVAGSGKSVQGQLLAKRIGYRWVSTGELLRAAVTTDRQNIMLTGRLLSDGEMIEVLDKALDGLESSRTILDGFPRSQAQAAWLLEQRAKGRLDVEAIIHLKAEEDVVKERLLARGRPDDNEEAIAERFREYHVTIEPIISQFREAGVNVHDIQANQPIESVAADIAKALQV